MFKQSTRLLEYSLKPKNIVKSASSLQSQQYETLEI